AVLLVGCSVANDVDRPRSNVHRISDVVVIARDLAAVRPGVDDLRIARVGSDVSTLTSAYRIPAGTVDAAASRATDPDGCVVLFRPVDPIGEAFVGLGVLELGRRLVHWRCPARAAVGAYSGASVVRFNHSLRILRIDPQAVVIAMRHTDRLE